MARKKAVAKKTRSKKTTPVKEPSLKQNLVAMEQALEKGAADLGRRAKMKMPAIKEATVEAATWLVNTSAAVAEDIRAYLVDLWRRLTAEKKAHAGKRAAAKKASAGRRPAARKQAASRTKPRTAKRSPARRMPAARKTTARRTTAKKRSTTRKRAVSDTK